MKKDYILWGALGCALVGTFHAEYTLGVATGANAWVALTVPGSLDLYVVRALQVRRDVFVAVLVMAAANVASRLVHAGLIPVDWRLYSAVGVLAPFLLWRIHALFRTQANTLTVPVLDTLPDPGTVSVPEPDTAPYCLCLAGHANCERYPDCVSATDTADTDWDRDYLPADWTSESVLAKDTPVPVLSTLDLPPGFEPFTPVLVPDTAPDTLEERDVPAWGTLVAYVGTCNDETSTPTVRGLKEFGHMGTPKAQRLLKAAGVPGE